VNKDNKFIVHTRLEQDTGSAARITKPLYDLLMDGKHIAYYAHAPTKIRVPTVINGRFYVKPAKPLSGTKIWDKDGSFKIAP
jgi:hypothetical protein